MTVFVRHKQLFVAINSICMRPVRHKSITGYEGPDKALQTVTGGRIDKWLQNYEDFVGLTEVREAQNNVTQAENMYRNVQEERRKFQLQMSQIHAQLKTLAMEIEKANRGTDAYIELVTKENNIIREEKDISERLQIIEEQEKQKFASLSSAVRESHEKERARAERTKYWSIMGSLIGAVIGILGTTVNNRLRMRELKNIVTTSADTSKAYREDTLQLCETVRMQYDKMGGFLGDLKILLGHDGSLPEDRESQFIPLNSKIDEILHNLKKQESILDKEMKDVKKLLATGSGERSDKAGEVVYVGPEVETMIKDSEKNLEWKMKLSALGTVTMIYAVAAIAAPIVYLIVKGGGGS